MTLSEAIRLIRNLPTMCEFTDAYGESIDSDAYYEAIELAISALQAQDVPDTNVGDMVSRQKAIDAINNIMPTKEGLYEPSEVLYELMQLPYVHPEIIRCKDCKWWSNDDYRECSNPNYDDGYVTPAGFYCGYAKRKTDGQVN